VWTQIGPNGVTLNKDNALGPVQAMARAVSRAAGNTQADGGGGAAASAPSAAADTAAAGAGDGSRYDAASNATGSGNIATPAGAGAPPSVAASTAAGPPLTPALQAGSGTPSQADFAAPGVTAASPSLQRAAQTGALEAYEPASVPATSARGAAGAHAWVLAPLRPACLHTRPPLMLSRSTRAGVAAAQPGSALRAVTYTGSAYSAPSPAGSGVGKRLLAHLPAAHERTRAEPDAYCGAEEAAAARAPRGGRRMLQK